MAAVVFLSIILLIDDGHTCLVDNYADIMLSRGTAVPVVIGTGSVCWTAGVV